MIDRIDRDILSALRTDGRITWQDLGRHVGLSANAAADRVRRLQADGIITGWTAVVDPAAMGRTISTRIDIQVDNRADRDELEAHLAAHPDIIEAFHMSGSWDYELTVAVASVDDLDRLLTTMREQWRVLRSETRIVLHSVTSTR